RAARRSSARGRARRRRARRPCGVRGRCPRGPGRGWVQTPTPPLVAVRPPPVSRSPGSAAATTAATRCASTVRAVSCAATASRSARGANGTSPSSLLGRGSFAERPHAALRCPEHAARVPSIADELHKPRARRAVLHFALDLVERDAAQAMLGPAEDLRDLLLRGLLEARWVAAKVRLLLGRGLVRALRLADGLRQTRDLARPAVVVSARGDGSLGEIPHLRLLSLPLARGGVLRIGRHLRVPPGTAAPSRRRRRRGRCRGSAPVAAAGSGTRGRCPCRG